MFSRRLQSFRTALPNPNRAELRLMGKQRAAVKKGLLSHLSVSTLLMSQRVAPAAPGWALKYQRLMLHSGADRGGKKSNQIK